MTTYASITDTQAAALRTAHDILVGISNDANTKHLAISAAHNDGNLSFQDYLSVGEPVLHLYVDAENAIYGINNVLAKVAER